MKYGQSARTPDQTNKQTILWSNSNIHVLLRSWEIVGQWECNMVKVPKHQVKQTDKTNILEMKWYISSQMFWCDNLIFVVLDLIFWHSSATAPRLATWAAAVTNRQEKLKANRHEIWPKCHNTRSNKQTNNFVKLIQIYICLVKITLFLWSLI